MGFDFSLLNENTSNSVLSTSSPTLDSMSGSTDAMESTSYLSITLDFLTETNRDYNMAIKNLYRSILESSSQDIINESFADFGAAVKKIIDKFLAFIKSLFQRFITNLNSMVKSEKYLKKHSKDFNKFSQVHEFEYTGYTFTVFDNDIPAADAESEFISKDIEMDASGYTAQFTAGMDDNARTATIKNIENSMKEKYQKLVDELSGDYYDRLRGKIIGKDSRILEGDFANELFCVFRNGDSDKETFTVDSSYVTSAYSRFNNYEGTKKSIEHKQKEIENSYKNIKNELEKMIKTEGSSKEISMKFNQDTHSYISDNWASGVLLAGQVSSTMVNQMELYKKAKINQVQQMSNIHAMAFAAKLDAARDMFNQDKAILYKALYRIQGLKKEG